MTRLENISVGEFEEALEDATGKTETQRLLVAIIYKRGPSVPMIAEWLDMRPQTIYEWFDRLEAEPIGQAIRARERPGRPPKLTAADRDKFQEAVQNPPTEAGYDQHAWTITLARQFLRDEFGIEYSRRQVQRLLNDAGLTNGTTAAGPSTAVEDKRTEFWIPNERIDR
jgi:transposase